MTSRKTTGLQIHEAADIFPLMDDAEFDELTNDIETYGQIEEIVLFEGRILDGRNRYQACLRLGIEPRIRELDDEDLDTFAYVVSANLRRRHLSREQRDAVMQRLRDEGHTLQAIAGTVGVDAETVRRRTSTSAIAKVEGADGKARPATYRKRKPEPVEAREDVSPEPATAPADEEEDAGVATYEDDDDERILDALFPLHGDPRDSPRHWSQATRNRAAKKLLQYRRDICHGVPKYVKAPMGRAIDALAKAIVAAG